MQREMYVIVTTTHDGDMYVLNRTIYDSLHAASEYAQKSGKPFEIMILAEIE